jgi:hypothetical protein
MSTPSQITFHLTCIVVSLATRRFDKIPFFCRGIRRAFTNKV